MTACGMLLGFAGVPVAPVVQDAAVAAWHASLCTAFPSAVGPMLLNYAHSADAACCAARKSGTYKEGRMRNRCRVTG